jgi:ABC-type polysaccharide/polyol phosphate export permease
MIEIDDLRSTKPHPSLSLPMDDSAIPSRDPLDDLPVRVIRPRSGWIQVDWQELFAYRELLWYLMMRDVTVRYKQTMLGSAWAVIQPVMMMMVFTLVFGMVAKMPHDGYDLRLMSSRNDLSEIPRAGQRQVIVAYVDQVLHFRIINGAGKIVVDTDENRLPERERPIEDLRKQLETLQPPHKITESEKARGIAAVTSIVGHTIDDEIPYSVFVFAGLIPWTIFSQGFGKAATSLIQEVHLMSKVYFPRLFVPMAGAAVFLVDGIIAMGIYAVILLFYGVVPSWTVIFVPLLIAFTFVATLSLGLLFAALMVFYRDFQYFVPFLSQFLMFVTPVVYPLSLIRNPTYRWIMSINPMFGIVPAFRSAIYGVEWDFPCLAISVATAVSLCAFAVLFFRRTELRFVDFA